jgi:spore maturation protein CgeB
MSKLSTLAAKMRDDWDRRVTFDYRFWMSEAHASDDLMWESGERDSSILLEGVDAVTPELVVEIGCGVGRLLRSVSKRFKKIVGIDVSSQAIARAREFLEDCNNVELRVGDGFSLDIEDKAAGLVYSFAALSSVPVRVWASYILEMNRILADDGIVRLQLYLGAPQQVCEADTLHLRCFQQEHFEKAVRQAGFEVEYIKELILPFEVSAKNLGIVASLCSLRRRHAPTIADVEELARVLYPQGEPDDVAEPDMGLESWMSFNYAKQLVEWGDLERAQGTLEYALGVAKADTTDIRDLLDRITGIYSKSQPVADHWEQNLAVLEKRFPEVAKIITLSTEQGVSVKHTDEGMVLLSSGQDLDHPSAPLRAAERWVQQTALSGGAVAVFGFGGGYHIEALLKEKPEYVEVWEPDARVLRAALRCRNLAEAIQGLDDLQVGSSYEFRSGRKLEPLVRPQTQSLHPRQAREFVTAIRGKQAMETFRPSIGVLGPLQGGTLPIMGYVDNTLKALGQRSRSVDMSVFSSAYGQIDSHIRNGARRDLLHQSMMGFFSNYTLQVLEENPVDILISMALAPVSAECLAHLRSKGVITVLWFVEDYLRFTYWQRYTKSFDFVFTIQKEPCMSAFREAGIESVYYLPCACDPTVHRPVELSAEERARYGSAVSFVGAGYHNRRMMMLHLADIDFKIWGTEWPNGRPYDRLVQEGGRRIPVEEYVKIFNSSSINLNLHSSTERDGVDPGGDFLNPRTFELAACGAFQLCDARVHLPECFIPGKEIIVFRNLEELRQQISYFLEHEQERKEIAERARQRALKEHTYSHRLRQMLEVIYAEKYPQLNERHLGNSWLAMMKRISADSELYERCKRAYEQGFEANLDALAHGIIMGEGELTPTEQKLLFLFHIRKQMVQLKQEEVAQTGRRL